MPVIFDPPLLPFATAEIPERPELACIRILPPAPPPPDPSVDTVLLDKAPDTSTVPKPTMVVALIMAIPPPADPLLARPPPGTPEASLVVPAPPPPPMIRRLGL